MNKRQRKKRRQMLIREDLGMNRREFLEWFKRMRSRDNPSMELGVQYSLPIWGAPPPYLFAPCVAYVPYHYIGEDL